jgi:hypothetical protein
MEVASGIRRLGNGSANVCLLEEAGAVTIVDAGMSGYWADLPRELAARDARSRTCARSCSRTRTATTSDER